jgi:hypothetical protein
MGLKSAKLFSQLSQDSETTDNRNTVTLGKSSSEAKLFSSGLGSS